MGADLFKERLARYEPRGIWTYRPGSKFSLMIITSSGILTMVVIP